MWEKEKLLVTSNFSFSHSVFKRLVLQTCKNKGLFGTRLTINHTKYGNFITMKVCFCTVGVTVICLFIFVYLSSLPVAHLSDAPRRRLVVTWNSARIQDETTESSAWFFNVLGVLYRHTGPRFKVSSERQLVFC